MMAKKTKYTSMLQGKERRKYTVWVGGVEVTDNYVEFREAVRLYEYYSSRGYDDVIVQFEK